MSALLSPQDVMLLRSTVLTAGDMYRPVDVRGIIADVQDVSALWRREGGLQRHACMSSPDLKWRGDVRAHVSVPAAAWAAHQSG